MYEASMSGSVAGLSQGERMTFVRKVYGLFFASILMSVITGFLSVQPGTIQTAYDMSWPVWGLMFLMVFTFRFTKKIPGLNVFMLFLFSGLGGVLLGPLCYIYNARVPGLPLEAGMLTTAVFGGLTLYVMFTRQDFNFLGGFLFTAFWTLFAAGFLMMIFHVAALTTVYCVAGVLIFAGFVLYDTSNILTRLRSDEAAIGALDLYVDFLNLMMMIMRLLGGNRN